MYFLYVDESISNKHFVLAGIAIKATSWHSKTQKISPIKAKYDLAGKEIHTSPMLMNYREQGRIRGFEQLSRDERKRAVINERKSTLLHLKTIEATKELKRKKKFFKQTHSYVHLTRSERRACLEDAARLVASWEYSRLFAEAIRIDCYDQQDSLFEFAFSHVISRFDAFLKNISSGGKTWHGLVIQDNNEQFAKALTATMRKFHSTGTFWNRYTRIIENPLFVNSELTSMIQIADLCAYSTRRFLDTGSDEFFEILHPRFDRIPNGPVVGLRHYTGQKRCSCRVCRDHEGQMVLPDVPT